MSTMQSGSQQEIPRERHRIAATHDLIIILEETAKPQNPNSEPTVVKIHEFEVSKKALGPKSYLQRVFAPDFRDIGKSEYETKGDDPAATKLWLQLFHDRLEDSSYTVTTETVWFMFQLADKYEFDPLCAETKQWFARWYEGNKPSTIVDYGKILYPRYVFDHAEAVASATKYLAYNVVHYINEQRLYGIFNNRLRLDLRIIQKMNAARGRLTKVPHGGLYKPIHSLLDYSSCDSRKDVLFAYSSALEHSKAWPIEKKGQYLPTVKLLSSLERHFHYDNPHLQDHNCTGRIPCVKDFDALVKDVVDHAQEHFDGLCLDCMKRSKMEDEDADYWIHDEPDAKWDMHCRISHGRPTWNSSFMGRPEKMVAFLKKKKKAKH